MSPTRFARPLVALAFLACASAPAFAQEDTASEPAPAAEPAPKPRQRKPPPPKPAAPAKPAPASAAAAPANPVTGWPPGATSVSETYGTWTVTCTREDNKSECTLLQSQGTKGRREFAIEIRSPADGRAQGLILMPLGFNLEPGVSFKLDEAVMGKGAPFLSCTIDGCLVPVSLPTLATDTMKTAQNLTISAMKPDAKEPSVITVPLAGFGAALVRAGLLSN
ncbi:invasion associated locus B family protein [Methylobacterium sp. BTF04]|uniref:invasion associated locus B family protein n=1 Tax=Methylobacterium sp. BTF04 TaxID=2708300 RepID=UPI0013CF56C5|nr:invasion associated locus B family protein [Methylobacterium sp. BTF04]NEU12686.1 invasion associated locus B family protein [Methylobacterium sp. BTF04]